MTDLWTSLDRIIADAPNATALRTHGLGPIAAWRLRQRNEPVPPEIERLALGAAYASVTAAPLLQRVVDILQESVFLLFCLGWTQSRSPSEPTFAWMTAS